MIIDLQYRVKYKLNNMRGWEVTKFHHTQIDAFKEWFRIYANYCIDKLIYDEYVDKYVELLARANDYPKNERKIKLKETWKECYYEFIYLKIYYEFEIENTEDLEFSEEEEDY